MMWTVARRVTVEEALAVLAAAHLGPREDYPGSTRAPWACECLDCGPRVSPRLGNLRSGQGGCAACGRVRGGLQRRNDAAEAAEVMRGFGYEPLDDYPGVNVAWPCRCLTCDHVSTPRLSNVRLGLQGCPRCANDVRAANYRLPEDEAVESMRAVGLEPLEPYPGNLNSPWSATCTTCGDIVAPKLGYVRRGIGGCQRCRNRKIKATQLAPDAEARSVMLASGFEPLEPYPGDGRPWRCRCVKCECEVAPTYGNVKRLGTGCRNCAKSGFKVGEPACVYLVERRDGVRQYGITNDPKTRLGKHRAAGFTRIVEMVFCTDGRVALNIEMAIRLELRAQGVPPACAPAELPGGGWSETFAGHLAPTLLPLTVARGLGFSGDDCWAT
jgi:hypothetical protein